MTGARNRWVIDAERVDPCSARLNIVAIPANALLGKGERCPVLGMDAYLAKPLQVPGLQRVLAQMLPVNTAPPWPRRRSKQQSMRILQRTRLGVEVVLKPG